MPLTTHITIPSIKFRALSEDDIKKYFYDLPDRIISLKENELNDCLIRDFRRLQVASRRHEMVIEDLSDFVKYKLKKSEENSETLKTLEKMLPQVREMIRSFEEFEHFQPLLSEYWDKIPEKFPESSIKEKLLQVDQLKAELKQKREDLKQYKEQNQKKGKRPKKKARDEGKVLEDKVKMAQRELNSAEKPILRVLRQQIDQLKIEAAKKELKFQSEMTRAEWIEIVTKTYNEFRESGQTLLKEIRKYEKSLILQHQDNLSVVSVTQTDIDKEKSKCNICFDGVPMETEVASCNGCNQFCHMSCMLVWLQGKNNCPLCRHNII